MWSPSTEFQWHHSVIGVDERLFAETTGANSVVGVYDTGVDLDHPDLAANINPHLSYTGPYGDNDGDVGTYPSKSDSHGTAVAGIIAAKGNGSGVLGVAPNASLVGIDWFDDMFDSARAALDAISFASRFDVANWSIAFTPGYGGSRDMNGDGFGGRANDRFETLFDEGRDGLGTVIVKAAGNTRSSAGPETTTGNAQADWMNNIYGVLVVAATNSRGEAASYSSYGSNVLIAAPAASATTDAAGSAGADNGDYRNDFSGTSAAAPVVSGVVSLVLAANPNLGWRDVHSILALSASHTGAWLASDGRRYEAGGWTINGAENWNGGGMSHHMSYGYGMVNASAAVALAQSWGVINPRPSLSSSVQVVGVEQSINHTLAAGSYNVNVQVQDEIEIEHIELRLQVEHNDFSEFNAWLVAPDGTRFMLNDGDYYSEDVTDVVTFAVAGARGMSSEGQWKLEVEEETGNGVAELGRVEIDFYGSAPSVNDVHFFTDDFLTYRDHERDRDRVVDTDGGVDWLNLAAVSGGITADFEKGNLTVDGKGWTKFNGFENVISGRGNDWIIGNEGNNQIYAGRGEDTLEGGAGADILNGGSERDFVNYFGGASGVVVNLTTGEGRYGTAEGDRLAEIESLRGTGFSDGLTGDGSENLIIGAGGNDRIDGRGNNDVLIGGDGDDHLIGGGGDDVLQAGAGQDWLQGNEGNDRLVGGHEGEVFEGGIGNDQIFAAGGDDTLFGGDGEDTLNGGHGADRIEGGAGNDMLFGQDGQDVFVFNASSGQDVIGDFEIGVDQMALAETLLPTNGVDGIALTNTSEGALLGWQGAEVLLAEVSVTPEMLGDMVTFL